MYLLILRYHVITWDLNENIMLYIFIKTYLFIYKTSCFFPFSINQSILYKMVKFMGQQVFMGLEIYGSAH